MTRLLEKAFKNASRLPEIAQNVLARWLLEELEAERKWDKSFAESEDTLAGLADEALAAHRQGKTKTLNIDKL